MKKKIAIVGSKEEYKKWKDSGHEFSGEKCVHINPEDEFCQAKGLQFKAIILLEKIKTEDLLNIFYPGFR